MNAKEFLASLPLGGQKEFAEKLGVSKSMLSQMGSGKAPISPQRAVQWEQLSDGRFSRVDQWPDTYWLIWPELAPHFRSAPRAQLIASAK